MDAVEGTRTTRELAVEGLRAIAQLERYLAEVVDEPGYFGELAAMLRLSAADRLEAAGELCDPQPWPGDGRRRLRAV